MTSIFFRYKIIFGFVWKPENVRERKNKKMRKIIFLCLNNMENSKGKNVEEKMDLLAYSTSPVFFPLRLIRVLHLIICVLLFFSCKSKAIMGMFGFGKS